MCLTGFIFTVTKLVIKYKIIQILKKIVHWCALLDIACNKTPAQDAPSPVKPNRPIFIKERYTEDIVLGT